MENNIHIGRVRIQYVITEKNIDKHFNWSAHNSENTLLKIYSKYRL